MARSKQDNERAMERLRLKKEQLDTKIKIDEYRKKARDVTARLKAIGGRIR